jgi:hypothetical protein
MSMGDRKAAVSSLESIQGQISWQTDLGGEVQLEYAMALETVERSDEARQIYSQLTVISWSQKIRSQALQLLQGLEITKQIRTDIRPSKPFMDMASMRLVSEALKPGLRSEWDNDEKRKKYYKVTPWFDGVSRSNVMNSSTLSKCETFMDAHAVFVQILDPLKKIPMEVLQKAFRTTVHASDGEKLTLLKVRGLVQTQPPQSNPSYITKNVSTKNDSNINTGEDSRVVEFQSIIATMTGRIRPEDNDLEYSERCNQINIHPSSDMKTIYNETSGISGIYQASLNGTWDLVLLFSVNLQDITQPATGDSCLKRYEYGDVRRLMLMDSSLSQPLICTETSPVMWGLSTIKHIHDLTWDPIKRQVSLMGPQTERSVAPWQKPRQQKQNFQVIFTTFLIY